AGATLVPRTFPVDVNARDKDGATALHEAAWTGDLVLIGRLLDAGADPTITDLRYGSTPLEWAEHAYQLAAAELLRGRTGS
ncbi:ankyrin repeat domain-containing protein, partial [Mycobacteroides abscessus subsp. massiliense]